MISLNYYLYRPLSRSIHSKLSFGQFAISSRLLAASSPKATLIKPRCYTSNLTPMNGENISNEATDLNQQPEKSTPDKPINNSASISVVDGTTIVREGSARILFPAGNAVFYNPVQQFNRDLSTLGIRAWSQIYKRERAEKRRAKSKAKQEKNAVNESTTGEASDETAQITSTTKDNLKRESTDNTENDENKKLCLENAKIEENQQTAPFIDIIEALSASGLRAIRYASEIPFVRRVYANDFSASAVESIKKNAEYCNVQNIVIPNRGDANLFMYTHAAGVNTYSSADPDKQSQPAFSNLSSGAVHVVDLDPYGSASPFVDAAVRCVHDGGLMLVTCTDASVLAGNGYPEKCFSLYGGHTLNADGRHESALRLVLHMISTTAAKYGLAIEPQLSLSIDFYVRLFIRVRKSPAQVKFNASKTMTVYHCQSCNSVTNQTLGKLTYKEKDGKKEHAKFGYSRVTVPSNQCAHCGQNLVIVGPMWGGRLHNPEFIEEVLKLQDQLSKSAEEEEQAKSEQKEEQEELSLGQLNPVPGSIYGTLPRIKGMLTAALNELPDAPFFVHPQSLASKIKTSSPSHKAFISAICNAGYQASYTHAMAGAVKTDAPYSVLWDIFRAWIIMEGKEPKNKEGSPGFAIMQKKEPSIEVSFADHPRALELETFRKQKLLRYQVNPTKYWGPKAKASG